MNFNTFFTDETLIQNNFRTPDNVTVVPLMTVKLTRECTTA